MCSVTSLGVHISIRIGPYVQLAVHEMRALGLNYQQENMIYFVCKKSEEREPSVTLYCIIMALLSAEPVNNTRVAISVGSGSNPEALYLKSLIGLRPHYCSSDREICPTLMGCCAVRCTSFAWTSSYICDTFLLVSLIGSPCCHSMLLSLVISLQVWTTL